MISNFFLICVCVTSLSFTPSSAQDAPEAVTQQGRVRGRTVRINGTSVIEFFGIPFAQPPIGLLRFDKPRDPIPWSPEVYDTTLRYAAPCSQPDNRIQWSEDCLYLNIWAPANRKAPNRLFPVHFFIHGGGYVYGSAMEPIFNTSVWPMLADVVIVTANYRLASFGFFHGNRSDAPGNLALWDQAAALKWTKANIGNFGGDPDQINLFGQSAGSASVGIHATSPVTRSLVKRMVMMSGSPFVNFPAEFNIEKSKKIAGHFGCDVTPPNDYVSCMRSVAAQDIVDVTGQYNYFHLGPNTGDEIYPIPAPKALSDGNFNPQLQLMSGLAEDEGVYVLLIYCKDIPGFERSNPSNLTKDTAKTCLKNAIWHAIKEEAADYYLKSVNDTDSMGIRKAVAKCVGDFIFTCPTYFYSSLFAKKLDTNNVYSYHLSYATAYSYFCWSSSWAGVCHGDELFPLFGDPIRRPYLYNSTDAVYASQLVDIWTTFGRTGAPPAQNGSHWSAYQDMPQGMDASGVTISPGLERPVWPSYMEINPLKAQLGLRYRPYADCDNFWSKHMDIWNSNDKSKSKYRQKESKGKEFRREVFFAGSY